LPVSEKRYYLCEPSEVWGIGKSSAYILSKATAKKILDFQTPTVKTVADGWIVYSNEQIISGVDCVFPMPVEDNNRFGSDIGYSKNRFQSLVKDMLIPLGNKTPLLKDLIAFRRKRYAQRFRNIYFEKQEN